LLAQQNRYLPKKTPLYDVYVRNQEIIIPDPQTAAICSFSDSDQSKWTEIKDHLREFRAKKDPNGEDDSLKNYFLRVNDELFDNLIQHSKEGVEISSYYDLVSKFNISDGAFFNALSALYLIDLVYRPTMCC